MSYPPSSIPVYYFIEGKRHGSPFHDSTFWLVRLIYGTPFTSVGYLEAQFDLQTLWEEDKTKRYLAIPDFSLDEGQISRLISKPCVDGDILNNAEFDSNDFIPKAEHTQSITKTVFEKILSFICDWENLICLIFLGSVIFEIFNILQIFFDD